MPPAVPASTTIALSKRKLTLLALGCLAFVAIGAFLVASPATFRDNPFVRDERFVRALGVASVVLFGLFGFYIGQKLLDTTPGLVVGPEGFVDNSSGLAAGLLPWAEVAGVDELALLGQRFVVVHLRDPAAFIARQPNAFKRRLLATNLSSYGSPVFLSANTLQCTHAELKALLAAGLAGARAGQR